MHVFISQQRGMYSTCTYVSSYPHFKRIPLPATTKKRRNIVIGNYSWNATSDQTPSEGVRTWDLDLYRFSAFPSSLWQIGKSIRLFADHTTDLRRLQLTCVWAGVFQFCSFCSFQVTRYENNETAVLLLAPGPTIYPFLGPRSGPTTAYLLNRSKFVKSVKFMVYDCRRVLA